MTTATTLRRRKPVPLYRAKGAEVKKTSTRNDHIAEFIRKYGANEFRYLKMQVSINRIAS